MATPDITATRLYIASTVPYLNPELIKKQDRSERMLKLAPTKEKSDCLPRVQ